MTEGPDDEEPAAGKRPAGVEDRRGNADRLWGLFTTPNAPREPNVAGLLPVPPGGSSPRATIRIVAPSVVATGYVLLVAAVGTGVLDTGGGGVTGGVAVALHALLLLVGLSGTLALFDDARSVSRRGAAWDPNPWAYVVGGALALTAFRLATIDRWGMDTVTAVQYAIGFALVAGVVSSIVAGPLYLLRRRRRIGSG